MRGAGKENLEFSGGMRESVWSDKGAQRQDWRSRKQTRWMGNFMIVEEGKQNHEEKRMETTLRLNSAQ
jgi:hypothetical protein